MSHQRDNKDMQEEEQHQHKLMDGAKSAACKLAVDKHIRNNMVIGIGSGSTMVLLVTYLCDKVDKEKLNIKCIPTSYQSKQLIKEAGLPLSDLHTDPCIDVTIDGADEVDRNFVAIKGGGGCLLQEKIVASASKKFIVVADYTKDSEKLGQSYSRGIPIEVIPIACLVVIEKMKAIVGQNEEFVVREGSGKVGPLMTDNGNFILDWKFSTDKEYNWASISDKIKLIPGVVETGIFYNLIDVVYYGQQDEESVTERLSNK